MRERAYDIQKLTKAAITNKLNENAHKKATQSYKNV